MKKQLEECDDEDVEYWTEDDEQTTDDDKKNKDKKQSADTQNENGKY